MSAAEPAPVPLPPRTGVVGGGRMGAGIAHALLLTGSEVVLVEADAGALPAARDRVAEAVRRSAERGALADTVDDVLARLQVATSAAALAGSGLVVEAVPEDVDLKAAVFADVEAAVPADAVIATNTSSLPVTRLAAALQRPGRALGLHFFNPVPASLLVEVVVGERTAPAVVARATGWVGTLGKTPVVVRDSPGFASSRLGLALGLEAIRMVEEGVASAEDIDAAMTLGYKHPVGPLRLTDLVGLDVRLGIARHLAATLGPRFAPPDLLAEKVARGELGRKTGRGFYDWSRT
ncbi:3-hydroxyacyl-CoA dehydrogenase family protein [Geodermatophilus sp. DSM 44513]|uniref:3-hydroxyacyl-CoA dehydrogenase family protein n=1 Tax=Geodermatophilus sp. DSM 44513 TaxID=1528104 RepID=UPI00127C48EB|nr:3-hydroxyacyl-CoA dehydrogenase family protein [Geodermatophilus sp. DSM 44513]WNV74180.1 3-hydroxyacyl-CoA dehydrogenase family protein [Geodermatophilus sp. DSM 44513]